MVVLLPLDSVETMGLVVMAVEPLPAPPTPPAAKMVVVPMAEVMVLPPDVMVVCSVEVVMAEAEWAVAEPPAPTAVPFVSRAEVAAPTEVFPLRLLLAVEEALACAT